MAQGVLRQRGNRTYKKPALSRSDLVQRMIERGLKVPDRGRAERYIRHIGYFRLSPYARAFRTPNTEHQFRSGTSFDDVLELYVFDRELRLLVLDALERVEVAIRTAISDHMSLQGGPHWYTDSSYFADSGKHSKFLEDVRKLIEFRLKAAPEHTSGDLLFRSAMEHYLLTYNDPELPPSWLLMEELTFGQLESLVGNLSAKADIRAAATQIGIARPILLSWLKTYRRVRNICAHHGRLWNVGLGVYPALPKDPKIKWLEDTSVFKDSQWWRTQRLYPVLVSLQTVLFTISPHSTWAVRFAELLEKYPRVPLHGMGVPANWRDDEFWKEAFASAEHGSTPKTWIRRTVRFLRLKRVGL